MAAYTLSALEADIRSYCEVDSNVFTGALLGRFIQNVENRILYDLPMDSDRKSATGNFAVDDNTINNPAGALFVRAVEVFDSTSVVTGNSVFFTEKRCNLFKRICSKINRTCRRSYGPRCYGTTQVLCNVWRSHRIN